LEHSEWKAEVNSKFIYTVSEKDGKFVGKNIVALFSEHGVADFSNGINAAFLNTAESDETSKSISA